MTALVSVTITGADDAVDVADLVSLSRDFPFVEWGVLFSVNRMGTPRYPSRPWINRVAKAGLRLSAHLCGSWARDVARGHLLAPFSTADFGRVQINGYGTEFLPGLATLAGDMKRPEWILQARSVETLQQTVTEAAALPASSVLFDPSGGRGVEPFAWPRAPLGVRVGYAGGISPENVEAVVGEILLTNGGRWGTWIDMESGVRTSDDAFSIPRAREVLERVAKINARTGAAS